MAALYPSAIRSFTTKANTLDIIDASHPNLLQDEVVAIENILGVNPHVSTGVLLGHISGAHTFPTVAARLENIEKAVGTGFVSLLGGSVINPTSASIKGLVVRSATGQTANLQEWYGPNNTVVAYVSPSGQIGSGDQTTENLYVQAVIFG